MRQFLDGSGNDVTNTVVAYLQAARQLRLADLYLIGEVEDPDAVWMTTWSAPLEWSIWGTFQPAVINRSRVTSKVGLEVDSLDVTWSPPLTAFGTSSATTNPYQKAQLGSYDNRRVRIWRTVMPTPGDANTLGACEWFGGWIANTEISRSSIKFTVQSFLNVINQKVPPNVIELSNTLASFVGATPVLQDGETVVPTFTVKAPSNTNLILGDTIQPTAHKIYATGRFRVGYMVFLAGSTLAGYWAAVANNSNYAAGGGIHYNEFQTFQSFPFAPTPGDTFYVSTQWPVDLGSSGPGQYFGFPYVPQPVTAV